MTTQNCRTTHRDGNFLLPFSRMESRSLAECIPQNVLQIVGVDPYLEDLHSNIPTEVEVEGFVDIGIPTTTNPLLQTVVP